MEYLYGFLSNISRDLVCGAVNQLRYPCCFNNFVKELEKEERNLIAIRRDVKDRVDHAKKQTKKTAEVVHKWLEDTDIGEADVKNLLIKAKTKTSCCFGHCPNWILRYHFGRKLANKKKELEELIKKGEPFVQLERVATLPSETLYFPSDKYLKFGSREYAFKQVMEAVKDEEINMIGLYGMGGCGKTTLAEEVKKITEAEHLFDKVLFVTVSSTVEVRRIQEKIARSMQYTFPVSEERERAIALCERLNQENEILVILDDVRQRLDFGAIGIPLIEHHKSCKVLITTRSEDVCTLMNCQKRIQLQILTDDEAWTLFQKQAHISEDTYDNIKHLARGISDKCKGLPVAIAAVAGSLKGKNEVIWKVALNKLRSSKPVNIEKGLTDPYKCLRLSYDNLDTEEAKALFLLCSVFPIDYKIPIEVLTKLAIGLGVVGEVRSYDEAKREVIAAKIKLESSSLLMLDADDDDDECVKMHELVRDVAHLIAKDENIVIKCELENDVALEQSSIRYLWCKELSNELDWSNLEFLYIVTKLEISDEFFKRMGKLKVLYLANEREDNKLPLSTMSFKTLIDLRCLILIGWELNDTSFVRDTTKLQSLTLYRCLLPSFLYLQTDDPVKQLTDMKLLEFIECQMERNNYNVIRRIPQLEELHIIDGNQEWDDCNEDTIEFFKTFSVPQSLQSYVIKLGNFFYDEKLAFSHEGILLLSCFHLSNEAIKGLATRAKVVGLGNIEGGAKNIIPDIFQMKGSMNKLNDLQICHSKEIECLVDTRNSNDLSVVRTLFSQLLQLKIWEMDNLRVVWDGCLPPNGSFQSLEKLHLQNCPELTCLFTEASVPSPVRSTIFQNLQQVEVAGCEKLKYVFSANTVSGLPQLKQLLIENCNELDQIIEDIIPSSPVLNNARAQHDQHEIIQESTSIPSASVVNLGPGAFILCGLTRLELLSCPKLSLLFMTSTARTLTSLKELTIKYCHGLKHIVARERFRKNQKDDMVVDDHDLQSVNNSIFLSLKKLHIVAFDLLQHIFPVSFVGHPSKLQDIRNKETPAELKYLFGQNNFEDNSCHLEPENVEIGRVSIVLEELNLEDLPQMTYIWVASKNSFNLQYLKTLTIVRCAKLEIIFPLSVLRYLPELESLKIRECKELKQILEQDLEEDKNLSNLHSPNRHFPKLTNLVVEKCDRLERVLSTYAAIGLSNLKIRVDGCAELKELIECEHGKGQFSLSNLTSLELYLCPKLSSLFSVSTAKTLTSLKELTIKYCDDLKHIITHERVLENEKEDIVEDDLDLQDVISILRSLKTLTIIECAKLETIFPLSCLPELESVIIKECNNLSSIGLSNLEILIISGATEVEELIGCEPGKGQFTLSNLTSLELYLCPKLRLLFSAFTAKTLTSLKELTVKYCDDLEHIVTHERVQKNEKEDIIEDDHDLQSVISMFPSLKTLEIKYCAKLEVIFPPCCLPELVTECKELKQIMEQDLLEGKSLSNLLQPELCFPKLRKLVVENCDKLKGVLSTSASTDLSNLEILFIYGAAELEELIGSQHKKGHEIEKAKVELSQAIVPSSGRSTILQNLQKVIITRCGKLKYVFSANTVRGLPKLKELLIRDCNELDQIIEDTITSAPPVMSNAQHDQHEIIPEDTSIPSASLVNPGSFTLSGLTSLEVDSCPKLGSLFTVSMTKTLTSLEGLMIRDCPGLKHLLTYERSHGHKKEGRVEDDHDLESVISMFSGLKTVNITGCDLLQHIFCVSLVGGQNNYEDKSCHLQHRNIQIGRHVSFVLENLDLVNLPQMTNIWVASKNSLNPQYLKTLKVDRCAKLEVIFPVSILRCLSELKRLEIKDCKELKQIVEQDLEDIHFIPSESVMNNAHAQHEIIPENTTIPLVSLVNHCSRSFILSNLTSFVSKSCPKLSSLFTVSTAKTLSSLQELSIQNCHGLKHIVTRERDHKNQKEDIVEEDHNLQSVILTFSSLKRVYISVISMFQSLKKVYISACDLLEHIFCAFLDYEENSCHLKKKKNIQIGRQVSFVLEKLDLINLPQMTYIWVASKNSVNLQYLKTIKIKRCAKLEVIFPLSVLRYLPELESLEIRQCKELKHIMEQDLFSPLPPQPCFPKLTKLVVEKCDKLKRVLSTSASIGLSSLEILIINGAAELEGLFGCEHGKGHEIENAKVELPKLRLIIFMHLPNLCQGIKLLAVKHRIVHNCPELTLTSTTTLRELKENFPNSDFENAQLSETELQDLSDELSLQINEEVQATTASTNLKLTGMSSANPLDISQRETNIELVDQEYSSQAGFPDHHALEDTINTEDIRKESNEDVPVSNGPTNKTLSTDVEGISLGGGVATHTKSSGGDILAQGSKVAEIDDKMNESKTGKLFADLDDTQIALLEEAKAAYPPLWDFCQKSSERFQAWMLKTLTDMLFLQNESANGVTPQREKEFHKLCDEAIQLGFDSSWVNEMRQHVVARDPKPGQDQAQSQINELFKRMNKASNRSLLCRSIGVDMVPDSQVVEQGDDHMNTA